MSKAKYKAHDTLYTKEGEKDIYRLAKASEKNIRDLRNVKCVKDRDNKVLVMYDNVKKNREDTFVNYLIWIMRVT